MSDDTFLNPGSDEAIEAGCTCPVLDNAHGRGVGAEPGTQFWYTEGCPLLPDHTAPPEYDAAQEQGREADRA